MSMIAGFPARPLPLWTRPRPAVGLEEATRILSNNTLKKEERQYRPVAYAGGPAGEIYVAYQSPEQKYLARVEKDGRTAWETPLQLKSVQNLVVSPDGQRVMLKSEEGLQTITCDGKPDQTILFPSPIYGEGKTDSKGNLYLVKEGRLVAWDPTGKPLELSSELGSIHGQLTPTPEGGLLVQSGKEIRRVSPGGQPGHVIALERKKGEGKVSYHWGRIWPLEGNALIAEEVMNIEISGRHAFMGRGYGGFGGFGSCMDPDRFMPSYVTKGQLAHVAPDGTITWRSEWMSDTPNVFATPRGTVYVVAHKGLDVYGPDGQAGARIPFEDASYMRGHRGVLVSHPGGVTRLGELGEREDIRIPTHDFRLKGDLPDGRLVFEDVKNRELLAYQDEVFVPLTDRYVEHLPEVPDRPVGSVAEKDGYVIVNGVRIKVRS